MEMNELILIGINGQTKDEVLRKGAQNSHRERMGGVKSEKNWDDRGGGRS
jgi:hypothetical protein